MKVRYKITLAFILLTIALLTALCIITFYIIAGQQQRDFDRRLFNRTATITSLLNKLPANGYQVLSKIDSSTANLLSDLTIHVYNDLNESIYEFSRNVADSFDVDPAILNKARKLGKITTSLGDREMVAVYDKKPIAPIVIVTSAIDKNGRNNLNELSNALLTAFLAGIFLSFVIGWIFSVQLLKPVERIATTVDAISANNLQERLTESKVNDEWNRLSVTFNGLLQRLQDSFEIQGRFISNASHELSTPLTSVSNQIDVILQNSRSTEEYLAVLQSVRMDVHHMSELTRQLLNMARTARGGTVNTEPVRVDEIIMELPALLKKISPDYNALLSFDELPENEALCTVNGNYELLLSAFRNIAENGCKYSPDHTIHISLLFSGTRITVLFRNQYESFNAVETEKIFEPFQRGSNAVKEQGYGLGLSLTRRILLLHRGGIKAEINNGNTLLISVVLPSSFTR